MPLSLLLALALQTAPASAAAAPSTPAPAIVKAEDDHSDIPSSAPQDDYGFVAWCRGALSGHMQLYPSVKDELHKIESEKAEKEDARYTTDAQREAAKKRRVKEAAADVKLDQEQLAAGDMYLKLYTEALEAAEAASASNLHKRGVEARDAGFRIWAAARGAEPRTRMWSWVMWELPARCETAARRLKDRSLLLGGALKTVEAEADTPKTLDAEPEAKRDGPTAEVATNAADAPAAEADKTPSDAPATPTSADASPAKPAEASPPVDIAKPANAETPPPASEAKAAEESAAAPPVLRGELQPTSPPADAPIARRESNDTPAPAPAPAPSPEAPKP